MCVQATCAANGVLRIYECHDIMALGTWNIQHEMQTGQPRCSCLAWNTSKYDVLMHCRHYVCTDIIHH